MVNSLYISKLEEALRREKYDEYYKYLCINYATKLLGAKLPVIFDTIHLSHLLGIEPKELTKYLICEELYYNERLIPKKNGKMRTLCIPSVSLKYIQKWILNNILYRVQISDCATGFCRDKSILVNAKQHTSQNCIINLDIKDFFPSVSMDRIFRLFYYYGYTKEVSFVMAKLCTYKGQLPQGSPASPYLTNIVCLKLDKRLNQLAKKCNATYTRYADDITISGDYKIQQSVDLIKDIIKDEGFEINQEKTRILFKHQKQEVTGLIVNNDIIHVDREYKRQVKKEIYYCLKYGVSSHLKHIKSNKSFYKEHLYGKVYFINMIEPELGKHLLGILDQILWEY